MRSFARAGFAAGPCLLKDTLQLAAFPATTSSGSRGHVNQRRIAEFHCDATPGKRFVWGKKTVQFWGWHSRAIPTDNRSSLSYKLKKLLEIESRKVLCTDPFITDPKFVSIEHAVEQADVIVLGAPHSTYRDLQFPAGKKVIDIWGFWRHNQDHAKAEGENK